MYKILTIADIHWGAIDAKTLYEHLYAFIYFVKRMQGEIDLVVICGDYFDYRLSLNSKAALLAIRWMHELVDCAKENGVKKVVIIDGTEGHDNNQLEAFRDLEGNFFQIIRENTVDEPIPGLVCMYCPEENINWKDYEQKYRDNFLRYPDITFFHGSFDTVLPDIVVQLTEETSAKSVVFNKEILGTFTKGPIVGGHWHDSFDEPPLHYIGSFDSWAHGEENEKGFVYFLYDPSDSSYQYYHITNPLAREYRTIRCDTKAFSCAEDYSKLIEEVEHLQKTVPGIMIRIKFTVSDDNPKNGEYLSALRHRFINDRTVKIDIHDIIKKKEREKEKARVSTNSTKYAFIFDKGQSIPEKLQQFILVHKEQDIPIDAIKKHIDKYLASEGLE